MNLSANRERLIVHGIVQGVGFRPFVYGLAARYGLVGHVGNNSGGVFIEVQGKPESLEQFRAALSAEAPPLSHIEAILVEQIQPCPDTSFVIFESCTGSDVGALIPPDVCVCDECLREMSDPTNRRYRYPFINCTHCGPRFTVITGLPYDRAKTTMAEFEMCPACEAEYNDPLSRRFHAQPIACPDCGPSVWYESGDRSVSGNLAIEAAISAIRRGKIVAVKGLGGYHLACDATNNNALNLLRTRKGRIDKPFAVMVRDLDAAHRLATMSDAEAALLTSRQRPILLLRKRPESPLSGLVAPGNPYVGIMLPYTPLHVLLLNGMDTPLVMTSGNLSGEPIATDNDEARQRLTPLVDAFLLHDRPIYTPCDDSVIRVHAGEQLPIRRSRGYTPFPVKMPFRGAPLLAVGGELKNTFCLLHGSNAFLSQHIGDMENLETLNAFTRAQTHLCNLYRVEPEAVVCDMHPLYMTTQWAQDYADNAGVQLIRVQHHHAHIASVMAEHGLSGEQPVIGVCFDGTGFGTDGTIWGGEVLIADYADFRRAAYLKPVPLPGGDTAIKRPYRIALAHLWAAGIAWDDDLPCVSACPPSERRVLARTLETGFQTVPTTSMGRLFDAVASLIGVRHTVTYEAQAAIELEGELERITEPVEPYPFAIANRNGAQIIDPAPVIAAIAADVLAGVDTSIIAARFHESVADMVLRVCLSLRSDGYSTVALSGGVFQNIRLLDAVMWRLRDNGFTALTHRAVPPNDGGLALGQAAIGAKRFARS
jgi:hydrogenase maturation protein HypF